jgi:carbamoyltransferase
MQEKPIYILGIGLSHDGSACILKDGRIIVAIEKERITRVKHDGGNDNAAVQYCLDAANITMEDLSLVVQAANFEKDEIQKHNYKGARLFAKDSEIPFVTLSHHLAHAYYAYGSSPFEEAHVLVLDGCGSFYTQCDDLGQAFIPPHVLSKIGLYAEKDSYYHFTPTSCTPLYKDFSEINLYDNKYPVQLPTSRHSIGGFYAMVSNYCFGSYDDAGKLMGLAPYGRAGIYTETIFECKDDTVWVNQAVLEIFTKPANPITHPFKEHFQYYADIAYWVQKALEEIVLTLIKKRLVFNLHTNICYTGGVALNAVANKKIALESGIENLYITPAAGDNGLSIGCAYYGWMQVLQQKKIDFNSPVYLGKTYAQEVIIESIQKQQNSDIFYYQLFNEEDLLTQVATLLAKKKIIGWFQNGAEFGPRALGNRSILAHPNTFDIKDFINHHIKLREDFRPFAPSILKEYVSDYFVHTMDSPHMLLINDIKPDKKNMVQGIVHEDGTCRVQTVTEKDNFLYYTLLQKFYTLTSIPILLNTSLNRKGMPIVETPTEAIDFFCTSALDCLVLHNCILYKK